MEHAQCLLLDEPALLKLQNDERPVFIYERLRFLDKVLPAENKNDIVGSRNIYWKNFIESV